MDAISTGLLGDMGVALTRFRCGKIGLIFRDKPTHDYGIDGEIEIIESARATGRLIAVQVKCGPSYFSETTNDAIVYRFNDNHFQYWIEHSIPVVVVLVDPDSEQCFWAHVNSTDALSTGANYKLLVPRTQRLDAENLDQLKALATPLVSPSAFEKLSEEDVSAGGIRRLSYYVRLQAQSQAWTKPRIEQVIRQVTSEARTSDYFRSDSLRNAHSEVPPKVVWVYVYFSESHRNLGAYVARSIWVSDDVPVSLRPVWSGGRAETGLNVDWHSDYETLVAAIDELRVSKAEFFSYINARLFGLSGLLDWCERHLRDGTGLHNQMVLRRLPELAAEWKNMPMPPIECDQLGEHLANCLALIDNARLMAERGTTQWGFKEHKQVDSYVSEAQNECRLAQLELARLNK